MKRSRKNDVAIVLFLICGVLGFLLYYQEGSMIRVFGGSTPATAKPPPLVSACTSYREYPFPKHHTGLPYLADAFASHNAQYVTFVGINRGKCSEEWKLADSFATFHDPEYHRFMCIFKSGSGSRTHVLSDFIHSPGSHDPIYLIQCKIPKQFQELILPGQDTTTLHVDLHAMEDMELPKLGQHHQRLYNSTEVDLTPAVPDIPICHPAFPAEKKLKTKQFKLVGYLPITSNYALDSRKGEENKTLWSSAHRLPEWIDYHKSQGFDHFIIYDNDKEPQGPIEQILQPYIASGLVSYRWFPLENCMSQTEHRRMDTAQIAGSLAAFHRLGFTTHYFSYHDGDEYMVPLQDGKTVAQIAEAAMERDPTLDALEWRPTVMTPCNGTKVQPGGSVLAKWKCLTDEHYADVKLILRVSSMFYFCIHYPVIAVGGRRPNAYRLNDTNEGFLAHYRPENDPGGTRRDEYSGLVLNDYHDEVHYMDHFLQQRQSV
ncbi:Pfam:DUF23 [Seminavis robusta]|uniref:Pfam:DUF23 n=1 Tax=Seminavis robusta TaxID=568900 RepID=A0A9N8HUN7_9STRA|nr:Pfam:DUF23 [Seminavis robusta]|eukprot:Sro1783_g297280.1 Pfam:DUF23 (487) ;mRNA; r:17807-19267